LNDSFDVLGNGDRSIQYEANEIAGAFKLNSGLKFHVMDNGNIGVVLELPVTQLQIEGSFEKIYFIFLIEYVQDYPLSPPKVHILEPNLDPTQTPHMFIDNTLCYLKPDEDWSNSYSSYDVGLMIKSWIFAYIRWKQKGIWGWGEHEEPQPGPI
jgi:hypothetical protein